METGESATRAQSGGRQGEGHRLGLRWSRSSGIMFTTKARALRSGRANSARETQTTEVGTSSRKHDIRINK